MQKLIYAAAASALIVLLLAYVPALCWPTSHTATISLPVGWRSPAMLPVSDIENPNYQISIIGFGVNGTHQQLRPRGDSDIKLFAGQCTMHYGWPISLVSWTDCHIEVVYHGALSSLPREVLPSKGSLLDKGLPLRTKRGRTAQFPYGPRIPLRILWGNLMLIFLVIFSTFCLVNLSIMHAIRRFRLHNGKCQYCGYDTSCLIPHSHCPECGR